MPRSKLSTSTRKQIDHLPEKAQRTFKRAHSSALKQYKDPNKRRSKGDNPEKIAHKVAWNAVKKKYKKKGDRWVSKARKSDNKD
jgi:cation transport regulator